ncbi:6-carboxytetrahydropterin synthase [Virgibacillus sp. AGTR]|uniref:6-pyruvoyl trahydropterin synthase family protein n=1 Tax=unclassified Virgibacillus TaxID=2620237 RepID=UPI001965C498|nr:MULTISPECIES: 6-carboxytetrahydropterin synthase [unclassified Virgibacillus]MCC2248508.1 6-carboxytetrahydropterin synthase [Virgibacillus sp. AGTR]MDY7043057.1 6-carboxytetrahydropterin synthase [Virgibacillus sp. M23]QRZ16629.1 6-carboxytetrahydropterin synthase [Virgibacillus sp. AGTR]
MIQQIYPVPHHNYSYEINKDFHFAAAHYIPHQDTGRCQSMHGHTYFTNITIVGETLNHTGFLVNFKEIKDLIHKRFDHGVMNEDIAFSNVCPNTFPTTEIVARTIYELVQEYLDGFSHSPRCIQVYLRETPSSYCVYRPKENIDENTSN